MVKISGECLVIADVAGEYDALMRLLKKAPDVLPISVGDMIDRGSKSKDVVDFFKANGKALKGNHEHMCIDFIMKRDYYASGIWYGNGGDATVSSYIENLDIENYAAARKAMKATGLAEHLDSLPLYFELDGGGLVTHAPLRTGLSLESACDLGVRGFTSYLNEAQADRSIIWNRRSPSEIEGRYQIFGHNSGWGLSYMEEDKEPWGVCLDDSRKKNLTAMHWPSKEIFQESFRGSLRPTVFR